MNVLSECKDARDKASLARKIGQNSQPERPLPPTEADAFDVYAHMGDADDTIDVPTDVHENTAAAQATLIQELDSNLGPRCRLALDAYFSQRGTLGDRSEQYGRPVELTDTVREQLAVERATMRQLKRKRIPDDLDVDHIQDRDRSMRPRYDRPPVLDTMTIETGGGSHQGPYRTTLPNDPTNAVLQVILEKNLRTNPEQLRAFEIVAHHAIQGGPQLLMYVGGVGGTGKSHVVHSVLRLFHLLGQSKSVRVAAPTGAAAILIGGQTIHSLALLPDSAGKDLQELSKIWHGVDYLILDEISMVGAKFLSQLSARLQRARSYDDKACTLPFGGMNVIFTGDFGQLRPVKDPSLYNHNLVNNPETQNFERLTGISAIVGVSLWRQVNKVVLLKINQRQSGDKLYADLLTRIRIGTAKQTNTEESPSDYNILRSRYADQIETDDSTLARFADAPIIVGTKRLRDLLNLRAMGHHAKNLSADIELYHAKDKISGKTATGEDREQLWRVSSSVTQDSLGRLPLFPGMKVMVQENLAFTSGVVNGTEGTVKDIVYEELDGKRYPTVAYVHIPGSGSIRTNAVDDIVPIFPECTSFPWNKTKQRDGPKTTVSRLQLPLLPSYAYTDYKSQGRSLDAAIVDPASSMSLQGTYVMLSRVRALRGLCILRPFKAKKIEQRLSQELRDELDRLQRMDDHTRREFHSVFGEHPNGRV